MIRSRITPHCSQHTVTTVFPKKYAHGCVVLCFVVVMQSFIMNSHEVFIHIHQGCFAGTGAIVRLPQCQWSKPDGCGKISQCITTTKHSKAKTVCIFLGIYCNDVTKFGVSFRKMALYHDGYVGETKSSSNIHSYYYLVYIFSIHRNSGFMPVNVSAMESIQAHLARVIHKARWRSYCAILWINDPNVYHTLKIKVKISHLLSSTDCEQQNCNLIHNDLSLWIEIGIKDTHMNKLLKYCVAAI